VVRTWVMDFRRVCSRRAYELRRLSDGQPVARAQTDWVFLNGETLRPATIPEEMVAVFLPSAAAAEAQGKALPRAPFPDAPPPPPGVYTARRLVGWADVDPAGHVNNANYLSYFEDCRVQAAAAFGWPLSRFRAAGLEITARHYRIEYRQPAVFGDELTVVTWLSDLSRSSAVRHYTIDRASDGQNVARARAELKCIEPASGRPAPFTAEFLQAFAPNIVGET
jgi:acyl-CoA thioester hydrolase